MFPIWINDGKTEMPTDPIFYIIAKDGMYIKKSMGHFETMNKVNNISILKSCETKASLNISKIKARQFAQILTFFKEVYKKFNAEANIILHYNTKKRRYRIEVPTQGVTGGSVIYMNGEESYKDYIRIGTIHSHASMSAFHSSTDHFDEENWDGLHITLGHMNNEYFDISCSIMSGGERFMAEPTKYIEDIEIKEYEEEEEVISYPYSYIHHLEAISESNKKKIGWVSTAPIKDFNYPKKWMDKVHRPKRPEISDKYKSINSSPSLFNKSQQNRINLFEDIHYGRDLDWDPCVKCPYKDYKSDSLMADLLGDIDEFKIEGE